MMGDTGLTDGVQKLFRCIDPGRSGRRAFVCIRWFQVSFGQSHGMNSTHASNNGGNFNVIARREGSLYRCAYEIAIDRLPGRGSNVRSEILERQRPNAIQLCNGGSIDERVAGRVCNE